MGHATPHQALPAVRAGGDAVMRSLMGGSGRGKRRSWRGRIY